ncbi:MAG: SOUL family heme-binding protein [Halobacteriota archaeon]
MVETPSYKLEKKEDGFEIRTYAAYILAQVDVESDFDGALRNGFEILAHYIFGGNRKKESISMTAPVSEEKVSGFEEIPMMAPVTSEKISMTAPVTEEQAGERVHRVSFAMPSRFTLETLPEPLDKRITFTVVESRKTAATRFSGRVHEKLAAQKTEELSDWLVRNGIVPKSNFVVALYNPPFIPGIFIRNEIIVDI